jgi:hypothetical protein
VTKVLRRAVTGVAAVGGVVTAMLKNEVQSVQPKTPASLKPHRNDYKDGAWRFYKMSELGQWVHLLYMRAGHRTDPVKRAKDLYDAENYLGMMRAKLDARKKESQENV